MFELRKTLTFEAAHRLPHLPPTHKCARLHGHSFKATLVVKGSLHAEYGWVVDYAFMKEVSKPCLDLLDHHYLNDVEGLENPTSEVLARWMFEKLQPRLPGLHQVIIEETCTSECRYPAHP